MGAGSSHGAVWNLNSKPTTHVFELPRKIVSYETFANLADTAHQLRPTSLKIVLLLLFLSDTQYQPE